MIPTATPTAAFAPTGSGLALPAVAIDAGPSLATGIPPSVLSVVAQLEGIGGGTPTAVAAVLAFFVALLLAVVVTYRYARGYLRTRSRPLLYLTIGLLLLAPAPMFLRFLLGNVPLVSATERTLVVTASKLCGLLVILGVVHR